MEEKRTGSGETKANTSEETLGSDDQGKVTDEGTKDTPEEKQEEALEEST